MRAAIVYYSRHHDNTRRIAEAMAPEINAELLSVDAAVQKDLGKFDLIGLGSGIYFGRHHPTLYEFVRKMKDMPTHCFVFSTAGLASLRPVWHWRLVRFLRKRGVTVVGDFCCPGWDTVGPLRFIGGIHRKRPNVDDIRRAAEFARRLRTGFAQGIHPTPR
jgi:flavodoxin